MKHHSRNCSSSKWMEVIWRWADEYELDENVIPRNEKALINLTRLTIDTKYEYAGYYVNCDRLPDEYLESLLIFGDNIVSLPDSLAQMPNLNFITTNSYLEQQLPSNLNREKVEVMVV